LKKPVSCKECLPIVYVRILIPEKWSISLNYYEGPGVVAEAAAVTALGAIGAAAGVGAAAVTAIGAEAEAEDADARKANAR